MRHTVSSASVVPSCAAVALAALLPGCAPVLPTEPVERALVRDVGRVIYVRQKVGWVIDEEEIQAVLPDVLRSACQVDEATRAAGLRWLDFEIARRGGPPEVAWQRAGKKLEPIEELLFFARSRLVLARADVWVKEGKCPFWLEPDPKFDGVQVLARRWIVGAEAGGRLIVGSESGVIGFGAGGGGRLLGGYGLDDRHSLYLAIEGGGGARFTNIPVGERATIPDFLATFAVPVVGRRTFGHSGFVEAELGVMAYFNQVTAQIEPGLRAGVGIGGLYLRLKRGLLPRFTFGVTVDHAPSWGRGAVMTQIAAGLRAGFDLSR